MQTSNLNRDTASIVGDILPSILNDDAFWPVEPKSIQEAGIPELMGESLVCLQLLNSGSLSGRNLAERIGLPYALIEQQLAGMRIRQLVSHARPAPLNDFYYTSLKMVRSEPWDIRKYAPIAVRLRFPWATIF